MLTATCPMGDCDIEVYVRESEYAWWLNGHLAFVHNYCRIHDLFDCTYAHATVWPVGPSAVSDMVAVPYDRTPPGGRRRW